MKTWNIVFFIKMAFAEMIRFICAKKTNSSHPTEGCRALLEDAIIQMLLSGIVRKKLDKIRCK